MMASLSNEEYTEVCSGAVYYTEHDGAAYGWDDARLGLSIFLNTRRSINASSGRHHSTTF